MPRARCADEPERLDGPLVLTAQSVPSASLVPCLRQLPAGWTFHDMTRRDGETRISVGPRPDNEQRRDDHVDPRRATSAMRARMRSDRAEARCATTTQHEPRPAIARQRYYLFAGGCVTYHFDRARRDGRVKPVATISRALGFVTARSLRRYVHDYSDGRLDLDPAGES